jgi:thiol:disulfide interchange protein
MVSLVLLTSIFLVFTASSAVFGDLTEAVEITGNEQERSSARLEAVRMGGKIGVAVVFEGTDDLHYYARKETAAGGLKLQVRAESEQVGFGKAIFPQWKPYEDKTQGKQVEVYVGDFTIFVPIEQYEKDTGEVDFSVTAEGIACTSVMCLRPFEKTLEGKLDLSKVDSWLEIDFEIAKITDAPVEEGKVITGSPLSVIVALGLAIAAGLIFNVMPCVLPVIPLIVTRLINQTKESGPRRIGLGFAFCGGIMLFFAAFAVVSIVFRLVFGAIFNWGDHLRIPEVVMGMGIFLVILALFMFDVFRIGIPSSVTGKSSGGSGALGSVGMGFLAALLSTPCSGAILAAVLAWAQTQGLVLSTTAILLMGVGMAAPYAIVISVPSLLAKVPRPGTWMEMLRKAMGFILLFIAVNLLASLGRERLISVLYFAVIASFAVWMWGGWVGFGTPSGRKWAVRLAALVLAIAAGFYFLPVKEEIIDWQDYDAGVIDSARRVDRPVVIKFTAGWCTSCKWLEKTVYNKKNIAGLFESKGVVAIKADTTERNSEATIAHREIYGEAGVPVTIVFGPSGEEVRFRGVFGKEELKDVLEALPERED